MTRTAARINNEDSREDCNKGYNEDLDNNEDCSNESDAEPDAESDDEDGQESSAQPQHEEKTPDTGNNWLKQPVTRISLVLRQENAGKPNLKRGKIRNKA